jgi:hypothetical protein
MAMQPCSNCPFRIDPAFHGLHPARSREIASHLMRDGGFHCHQTVDYSGDDGEGRVTGKSKLCSGAALFLENVRPGGMRSNLALGVMVGQLDLSQPLDTSTVYDSIDDFIAGASG